MKSQDGASFRTARQLIRQEGLLVGGSSGAATWAALEIGREMPEGSRLVTLLPDSVRNYLTKFVDDRWMRESGFLEPEWAVGSVAEMLRAMPAQTIYTVDVGQTLADAVSTLKSQGISQLPVLDAGKLAGIITETDVLHAMVDGQAKPNTSIAEVMERRVATLSEHASTNELTGIFERGEIALIVNDDQHVIGILTKLDLIEYLTKDVSAV